MRSGLVQQQVLDVVQKTLDYIAEALAKGRQSGTAQLRRVRSENPQGAHRAQPESPETDVPIPNGLVVKFKPGKEMQSARF